jgi:hypothetical protein
MSGEEHSTEGDSPTQFDRQFRAGEHKFSQIGDGEIGGKAHGLLKMKSVLNAKFGGKQPDGVTVGIPTLTVIATDHFDSFMKQNDLYAVASSRVRDELIAHAFQKADLPAQLLGDLRSLVQQVHTPLAVRSSSLLEDAMFEPFAGVYATKMVPNNQPDADSRFRKLIEAIKFVYASTYFKTAQDYLPATSHTPDEEKMAVIIQEVVGTRFGNRFYPHISGVARSYNFYPAPSDKPADGVVELALGLGKTIVDDGISWSYSPASPQVGGLFKSTDDLLKHTQTKFWAINMGKPPVFDPIKETEYMDRFDLHDSEYDGSLRHLASTYDADDDKIVIGTGSPGARILDFSPLLKAEILPLNNLLRTLLKQCEDTLGAMVEIEFAVRLGSDRCSPADFGFLQVRPMVVAQDKVELTEKELAGPNVLLASDTVLGNGVINTIKDVVYVDPRQFDLMKTPEIAAQVEVINRRLVAAKRPYVLIGFGRWGTTDPYGGIPVDIGQISGAKVIVESSLPDHDIAPSQGSHFFHNVTSFKILLFSILQGRGRGIDWDWLNKQRVTTEESAYVRHVELASPLRIRVDAINRRGVIAHE